MREKHIKNVDKVYLNCDKSHLRAYIHSYFHQ
jgi:hypothetical protein